MNPTRRSIGRLASAALLLAALAGCDKLPIDIEQLMGGGGLDPATTEKLKNNDLPGVEQDLATKEPGAMSVEELTYLSFVQFSKGDYESADATLGTAIEKATPEEQPALNLRRALVARRAGKIEDLKKYATASALPPGKLMAAEVLIISFDQEAARQLFQEVQGTAGAVGATATSYLELINGGPEKEALAEITALWALGERSSACEQAEEVIPALPDDDPQWKAKQQLLWASRAVTSGHSAVAQTLLSEMLELPSPDQAWRRQAVLAMIAIDQEEYEQGLLIFKQLEDAGAPGTGLADAIGTAIGLCKDPEVAKRLAADLESISVAKGLEMQGMKGDAVEHAPRDSQIREMIK